MKKVALVTGSAKRLGREISLRLGRSGHFVWVHYRASRAEAEETLIRIREAGGAGALVSGDISRPEEAAAIIRAVEGDSGRLDLLVNNVGIYKTGPLLDFPAGDFELTLRTNLLGAYYLVSSSIELFPREGGSIINIGYAGIENLTASTHNTAYLISKSGLYILTRSYAEALGGRNIRVNMVSPGILSNSVELPEQPRDYIPLGRLGECADVCDAVEFLAGPGAAYITGINIDVAGGYMMGLRSIDH